MVKSQKCETIKVVIDIAVDISKSKMPLLSTVFPNCILRQRSLCTAQYPRAEQGCMEHRVNYTSLVKLYVTKENMKSDKIKRFCYNLVMIIVKTAYFT